MKMFKLGIEGGKPGAGAIGVQPEWAYKGDGSWLVAPEQPIELPGYAEDGGEEGEVAGLYVIGDDGEVLRVGFALGNEYSDHVMERRNYLYLAHSKLRQSSFGPEVLIGALAAGGEGHGAHRPRRQGGLERRASLRREPTCATRSPISSSIISNMPASAGRATCTSITTAPARSARASGFQTQPGDVFEVEAAPFGRPLRNPLMRGRPDEAYIGHERSDRISRDTRLEMTEELHHNLIAGEWVEGEGETENINPSNTDEVVGRYARASKADTERAIAAAKAAAPAWARFNIHARYEILKKASDEILARKEELGRLLAREEGKTLAEGIGEATRAGQIFAFFAGEAVRVSGELLTGVRPNTEVLIEREPVGVVGLITPWNFPIAIPAWKIAPALAYGNTVVFKPADLVPGCGWALADILTPRRPAEGRLQPRHGQGLGGRAGDPRQPRRERDLLHRLGRDGQARRQGLGRAHAKIPARDGRQEPARRARRRRPEDRRRMRRERRLLLDRPALHGLLAPRRDARASTTSFVGGLIERIKALNVDDALKEGTHIGPVVDKKQFEQDEMYIDIGRKEGAKLAWGGERLNRATPGFYLQPALFTETKNDMRINREEIFGPVASVIRVKNYDEALARRERHAVRPVLRHLHDQPEIRDRFPQEQRRPAW